MNCITDSFRSVAQRLVHDNPKATVEMWHYRIQTNQNDVFNILNLNNTDCDNVVGEVRTLDPVSAITQMLCSLIVHKNTPVPVLRKLACSIEEQEPDLCAILEFDDCDSQGRSDDSGDEGSLVDFIDDDDVDE